MTLSFIRCLFLIMSGVVGYYVGDLLGEPLIGTQIGCLSGLVLIFLEGRMQRVSARGLSSLVFGLLLGIFMAQLLTNVISLLPLGDFFHSVTKVVLTLVFSYLGAVMALRGKDEFNVIIPYVRFRREDVKGGVVLLDTSVVIDGRISDIYKTGFLNGRLVVPRFVLQELQALADSQDDLKRQRGRRGIDLLHKMQEDPKIDIRIHEDELASDQPVDARLIRLAKILDAQICTIDFNLNRVASLQGVEVLNINELVNALKPELYPSERIEVRLLKEGKEPNQAVAYLDDGTMIVVSDAQEFIGQKKSVVVTSVLQTQAGKMIFAKLEK